jgi:hypothetical protein
LIVGAVVLAWVAGCGSADRPSGSESAARSLDPIQGGTTDTTHNFAVGVVQFLPNGAVAFCSGVLLAPNLVATARHCVSQLASPEINCATSTFSGTLPASDMFVTANPTIPMSLRALIPVVGGDGGDEGVIVPAAPAVCGNDLALLILSQSINVPEYVTPTINPPMTDHQVYTTAFTAIGYGVDTPTDTTGSSAGVRRIRENINLVCIPNDPTPANCFSDPTARQFISPNEFEGGDGTCEGDSGSGAYDQGSFDSGTWAAFGVLSRGGVSTDGGTCLGSIYTRFDAWGSLIVNAAIEAAAIGGYTPPAWTGAPAQAADASPGPTTPGATACLGDGTACGQDTDCCSVNCIFDSNGLPVCVACDAVAAACSKGFVCEQGVCVAGAASADAGPGTVGLTAMGAHTSGGCAVGPLGSTTPPWGRTAGAMTAAVALAWRRRRRRKLEPSSGLAPSLPRGR